MSIIFKSYPFIKKLLFSVDAEKTHIYVLKNLQKLSYCKFFRNLMLSNFIKKPTKIMGLNFKNPVGLAAGMDKNAEYIDSLSLLGFGFIEVGTVTPLPQSGNTKPRLFRIEKDNAIVNKMGFNNLGIDIFLQNIKNNIWQKNGGILGINIGKNAITPISQAIDDYIICMNKIYNYADYITVNISSPNTKDLRSLQNIDLLDLFLSKISDNKHLLSDKYGRYVPIAIKIAPDLSDENIKDICKLLIKHKIDGIIATNTTSQLHLSDHLPKFVNEGGLSGQPLFKRSTQVISIIKEIVEDNISIIGSGGIMTKYDALEKINNGADAIQLYTGIIYKGPNLINDCIKVFH
ncbi:Dihydroorotate dehydrogenase (quinone) [Candidatus Kinetoplastibacterium sorsogonicusi]|uniref:Dihydroorotate dehydrogenase (quinone) n=1 Tax=Candidatus Kinetoplastidibacterium kentomonadis TaxID=1576550 RepID=A0A3Q8EX60_9PROT|nr:quinone-dependent dihydroorotate dehydrogenase [Candidatus Kinetoplastibacterium sorsogonicusi]AWD32621.1 Dihydroorotate dehydrogenase (quinone) [Candidatus Kinetoplastibacterium sorsogonicusi]